MASDKYDCIVSYHTNPYTCGVARFNRSLADEMQVPLLSIENFVKSQSKMALVSIKFDELAEQSVVIMKGSLIGNSQSFDLLLHDVQSSPIEELFCEKAQKVFLASAELKEKIRGIRPDAQSVFAPGAAEVKSESNFDLTLITFGMAHKIRSERYKKLGELLMNDHRSAQLEISTALPEGTTFSEEFFSVNTEISNAFSGNVKFLGFLADGEVSRRIVAADALVAFFPNGARENNTTVLSAMAHGCCVITNLDSRSPSWMEHNFSVLDIDRLNEFPDGTEIRRIGANARKAVDPYSFSQLVKLLQE